MTKTLVFAVYDYDRFSKHDAIGEVRLPVCQMDLAQTKEIWKELQSIVGDGKVSNELYSSLSPYLHFEHRFRKVTFLNFLEIVFPSLMKIFALLNYFQTYYEFAYHNVHSIFIFPFKIIQYVSFSTAKCG